MIDPDTVDESLGEPSGHFGMRRVEDRRILLAQAGQRGDREEAPVAAHPGAPVDQAVVLAVVHGAGVVVLGGRARGDRKPHPVEGQVIAVDDESLQVLGASEHRQHDPPLRVGGEVDVEEGRVVRVPAVPQDVPPPRVVRRRVDPGVVGHDVDDQTQAPVCCRAGQPCETVWPAQFGRDGRRVGHVVPVGGPRCGGQHGGEVEVRATQFGDVIDEVGGVVEGEGTAELEAVGG